MSLRARLFIIISLVVLAILAVTLLFFLVGKKKIVPSIPAPSSTTVKGTVIEQSNFEQNAPALVNPPAPASTPTRATSPLEVEQNAVKQLAKIFTERYNTYSTDDNFLNIKEIQDLVTSALWKRLSGRLNTTPTGPFVGVTTEVIGLSLDSWNPPAAAVTLQVRQLTTKDGVVDRAYRPLAVTLSKIKDAWLVDSFTWKK